MKKVFLVENGTRYLGELKKLFSATEIMVKKYSEFHVEETEAYDAIVLSGGHDFSVRKGNAWLQEEITLIKNTQKPILGICFGFELIAHSFGAQLVQMKAREQGILNIDIMEADGLFRNVRNFQVFENHRWVVKTLPSDFTVLARSKDGIEAFKHRTRPIYAVQFHPEMFLEKTPGNTIYTNFMNIILRHSPVNTKT